MRTAVRPQPFEGKALPRPGTILQAFEEESNVKSLAAPHHYTLVAGLLQ